ASWRRAPPSAGPGRAPRSASSQAWGVPWSAGRHPAPRRAGSDARCCGKPGAGARSRGWKLPDPPAAYTEEPDSLRAFLLRLPRGVGILSIRIERPEWVSFRLPPRPPSPVSESAAGVLAFDRRLGQIQLAASI